jgi:hypothetical protein
MLPGTPVTIDNRVSLDLDEAKLRPPHAMG